MDAKNLGHTYFMLVHSTCLLLFFIQLNIYLMFSDCVHMVIDERAPWRANAIRARRAHGSDWVVIMVI